MSAVKLIVSQKDLKIRNFDWNSLFTCYEPQTVHFEERIRVFLLSEL